MPDPIGAAGTNPTPLSIPDEPLECSAPPADALMCVDPTSGGTEGAGGTGTEALVRRFTTGGTGEPCQQPMDQEKKEIPSCVYEGLVATAACGGMFVSAAASAGAALVLSAVGCVGSLGQLDKCLDAQSKARGD